MLSVILEAILRIDTFLCKDYMELFKSISSATARRDLSGGISEKILKITGVKNQARYLLLNLNSLDRLRNFFNNADKIISLILILNGTYVN